MHLFSIRPSFKFPCLIVYPAVSRHLEEVLKDVSRLAKENSSTSRTAKNGH